MIIEVNSGAWIQKRWYPQKSITESSHELELEYVCKKKRSPGYRSGVGNVKESSIFLILVVGAVTSYIGVSIHGGTTWRIERLVCRETKSPGETVDDI